MGEEDRNLFISRIGTFFLLLGLVIIILFIATDIGQKTVYSFFFIGVIMLVLGWYFKRIGAPPPVQGKRFEGLRNLQQKNRDAKAKKEAEKNEKNKKK
jgi:Na+/citrate or Na+/malate symporter